MLPFPLLFHQLDEYSIFSRSMDVQLRIFEVFESKTEIKKRIFLQEFSKLVHLYYKYEVYCEIVITVMLISFNKVSGLRV